MSVPVTLRVKGPELYSVTVPSRCSLQEVKVLIQQDTGLFPLVLIHKGITYAGRILTEKETTFRSQDCVCMVCAPLGRKERGGTKLPMPEVKVLARGERQEGMRAKLKPFRLEVLLPRAEEKKCRPTLWVEDVPAEIFTEIVLPAQKPAAPKKIPRPQAPIRLQPPANPQIPAVPQAPAAATPVVNPMAQPVPEMPPPVNPMSQAGTTVGDQLIRPQFASMGFDAAATNFAMEMMKMPAFQNMLQSTFADPGMYRSLVTAAGSMYPGGQQFTNAMLSSPEVMSAMQSMSVMVLSQCANPVAGAAGPSSEQQAMFREKGYTDEAENARALQESNGDLAKALELLRQRNRN